MDTTIIDTLTGQFSCDSIVSYHFSVIPSSTGEINNGIAFELYPNPANGAITIHFVKIQPDLLVEVYDLVGQLRFTRLVEHLNEQINISDWEDGVYIVGIKSNNFITMKMKMIKIK
jgi:hypothetical protein